MSVTALPGVSRGDLEPDKDVEACVDLLTTMIDQVRKDGLTSIVVVAAGQDKGEYVAHAQTLGQAAQLFGYFDMWKWDQMEANL